MGVDSNLLPERVIVSSSSASNGVLLTVRVESTLSSAILDGVADETSASEDNLDGSSVIRNRNYEACFVGGASSNDQQYSPLIQQISLPLTSTSRSNVRRERSETSVSSPAFEAGEVYIDDMRKCNESGEVHKHLAK